MARELLHHADVEIVRALRQDRALQGRVGGRRGAEERGDVDGRRDRLLWRREVARVAGVERRGVGRLVDEVDARAELVGVDVLPHLVEAQTRVQRQLVGQPPFVLNVDAGDAAESSN